MEGGIAILCLSVAMFFGCLVIGWIPLLIKLSDRSLQIVAILGAGLLCGTSLAIIIPEGTDLLQDTWKASETALVQNNSSGTTVVSFANSIPSRFYIGLSLVFGFIFMFVVDQLNLYFSTATRGSGCMPNNSGITASLGLVIHSAADGVALGAAVASPDMAVQVIVFVAVIMHKVGGSTQSRLTATGVGMLFSGGTFLYVATVHVLPEVSSGQGHHLSPGDLQHLTEAVAEPRGPMGLLESLTFIGGAAIPVLLALGLQDD
ncbi:zinc transporter ZIP9 isoform X2 [Gadus macrocephalus]|uniref:zinc transporter ZIP9 isoform X2 n=1 Tax=Gadus macrocephalus TaxID=80720 RepID=UPI0028CB8732|nr:zinc transporter ZIP9 isoform X2 [Gadus macrocephalus]